jgi:RNA polymerase-binding transcription factor DksA
MIASLLSTRRLIRGHRSAAASLGAMSDSGTWSAPERFSDNDVELVDEIVISEDILDDDGTVIGEHVETIDVLEVDGEGVVVIDDITIVTDDEGDLMIDETVAVFDESGDVVINETITVVDAEGDVLVEEHLVAADASGDVLIADSLTIVDGGAFDDRQLAAQFREELDGVERALDRLDAGTYGRCESCGAAIEDSVLAERPQARSCSAHLV